MTLISLVYKRNIFFTWKILCVSIMAVFELRFFGNFCFMSIFTLTLQAMSLKLGSVIHHPMTTVYLRATTELYFIHHFNGTVYNTYWMKYCNLELHQLAGILLVPVIESYNHRLAFQNVCLFQVISTP